MTKPTVYIETSVVSYLVARPSRDVIVLGHQVITAEWWEKSLPRVDAFTSQAVLVEAAKGDPDAARRRLSALEGIPIVPESPTADNLARTYISEKLIPQSVAYDALHLALASVFEIEYLLTWNCRHLAAANIRKAIWDINRREGFSTPELCTPEQLMEF